MCGLSNMRFHRPLTQVLGSPIRVDLLRELARANGQPLSGRELARRVGASPSQVNQHLQELRSQGLVHARTIGRVHGWSLATQHVLVGALRRLFDEEPAPFTQLRERLEATIRPLPVERAVLFGSIARGDERPESDIDVFIETRGKAEKEVVAEALSRASLEFAILFGNPLSSLILTRAEVQSRQNPDLLASIDRDGLSLEV
ncbi:MAG TPA: nucleotidyltransferase domain-containing protein [Thermoplasmata archaeon]